MPVPTASQLNLFQISLIAQTELEPIYENGECVETFCNLGARQTAQFFGCHDFDDENLLADDMYKILSTSKNWQQVNGIQAQGAAASGKLVFAAMSGEMLGEEHGHIAGVNPGPMVTSPSLGRDVPQLCNIGKGDPQTHLNFIAAASKCFPVAKGEPPYFVWVG